MQILKTVHYLLILLLYIFTTPLLAIDSIISLERHITLSNNDAEEHIDGRMDISSSDLEMSWEEDVQTVGLRFQNITIPRGAIVKKAWIQFETDEPSDIETKLNIYVQENPNPPLFFNTPFNITSRKRSKQHVVWKPAPWRSIGEKDPAQCTPDLSTLIAHLINLRGWESGHSIVFIINGSGKRVAKAFTDNQKSSIAATPILHVLYTTQNMQKETSHRTQKILPSSYISKLRINEVLAANSTTDWDPDRKSFSDWIELYNESNQTIDLSGFYLSDNTHTPKKWQFPTNVTLPAHGYLRLWADGIDGKLKALHTNFKLRQKAGVIILSDTKARLIDKLIYPKLPADISFGIFHNQKGFMKPTPNMPNTSVHTKAKQTKTPEFLKPSGMYRKTVELALHHQKGASIYFTLDGSNPTPESHKYTKPFKLYETAVVRAMAIEKGKFPSPVTMHTYLIDENITLPIVSIGIDPKYLYDTDIGIVQHYDKHWIRKASVEYLKNGKAQFGANIGLKISGNHTRDYPQKSFALFFKKRFGSKTLHYPLFEDKPQIKKIKSFTLRNSGTYWGHSLISEGISHRIVMHQMDIDAQSYQPSILFLNGLYQGIYNIRERMNEAYIRTNHHVKGKIDLIEHDETFDTIKSGNIDTWYTLLDQLRTSDISKKENYAHVTAQLDLDEFINHCIIESYFGNSSIQHNVKHWRLQKPGSKWRTLLFDLDRGFDLATDPVLGYLMDQSTTNIPFTALIQNNTFRHRFLSRYFTHLNTTFQPKRVEYFIDSAAQKIAPEIARHFQKWTHDYENTPVSPQTWKQDIKALHRFAQQRERIVRQKLRQTFTLKGAPLLNIDKKGDGSIEIDGVTIKKEFSGSYFDGADVTLKALPSRGCRFDKWSDGETDAIHHLTLTKDQNITAMFHCN